MARFTFEGMDEYIKQLRRLDAQTRPIIGKAIHAGAKIVADEIRSNIDALSAVPDGVGAHAYMHRGDNSDVPLTETAKKGLQEGFGISRLQESDGFYHVKIGFHGYNNLKTRRFPNGQPNQLIARRLEYGSSVSKKHPFIKPAERATKAAAEAKMKEVFEQEIEKLMN